MSVYELLLGALGKERIDVTYKGDTKPVYSKIGTVSINDVSWVSVRSEPSGHRACPWCGSGLLPDAWKCTQCGGPQL